MVEIENGNDPMNNELTKALSSGKRILFFKSQIAAYTRKDGVTVAAHSDKRTKKLVSKDDRSGDLFAQPAASDKPVTRRVKVPGEGNHTEVTMPDGSIKRIQRLNSTESMGLPGWHDMDEPGHASYRADTEDEAVKELHRRHAASAAMKDFNPVSKPVRSSKVADEIDPDQFKPKVEKQGVPLKGHPYHDKSDDELRYIVKDAGETARIQRGMSSEGKYLDQMNDASTVLYHRKQNGIVKPHVVKPIVDMAKAIEPRVLFLKSHVKQFTRADGTIVKEHDDKRQKKMAPPPVGRKPGAPEEHGDQHEGAAQESSKYGHHNVEAGDSLGFSAGSFKGSGKVKSAGKDGAVVTDESGRDHNVHWNEVTGRGGDKKPPVDGDKPAPEKEDEPKKEEPSKPSNVVGINEKRGKAQDIARALFNTSEVEQLPKKAFQSDDFDSWEKINAKAPESLEQFTSMLKKVSGALGMEEGRRPLSLKFAQVEENEKAEKKGEKPETLNEAEYMNPALWNNPKGFLFLGPLKKQDRAQAKVTADYTDKKTGIEDWRLLKDMVRGTIAVPSVTQIPKVLSEMKKAGIVLAQQPKNNLLKDGLGGSGYRDLNLIVKLPNGMLAELQIHCKPMTEAKERGHEYYAANAAIERKYPKGEDDQPNRKIWSDEDNAEYDKNFGIMKEMYDEAWDKSIGGGVPDDGKEAPNDLQKSLNKRTLVVWKTGRAK